MTFAPPASRQMMTGRRIASRLRVHLPARLVLLSGEHNVLLCDLSEQGACIRYAAAGVAAPRLGSNAVLTWHHFEMFGEIRWITPNGCGLLFDEPLARADLLLTRTLDSTTRMPTEREQQRDFARRWAAGQA